MTDEKIPSPIENFLSRKVTRRGFIRDVALTGSALMGVSCMVGSKPDVQPSKSDTSLPPTAERIALKEVTPPLTKEEVRNLLEKLPASPYKDFAMRYGYQFFQDNPPKRINLSGVEITVADARVRDSEEQGTIGGRSTIRTVRQGKILKLQQDHPFSILLPHIVEGSDKDFIRGNINFAANQDFVQGIEPEVIWLSPKNSTVPLSEVENYKNTRRSAIIKEAFGAAFMLAYIEEVIKNMQANNMPVSFDENGQKIEAVSQAIVSIINTNGKLAAISDLGPLVLAAKAMQSNSLLIDAMREKTANTEDALNVILNTDFGSPNEMLGNSIKFILQNKDVMKKVEILGNLDQPY